jgi:hypothetical protein
MPSLNSVTAAARDGRHSNAQFGARFGVVLRQPGQVRYTQVCHVLGSTHIVLSRRYMLFTDCFSERPIMLLGIDILGAEILRHLTITH